MDREAFAKLLPEGAGTAITDWAQDQKEELGDRAYTVYRCERRYAEAAMEEARKQQVLSSPEAAVFRVLFQKVQEDFQQMAGALTQVEQKDPELAEKLRAAVRKLLENLEGKVNG